MYTEEDNKLRMPIVKFLVALILIILFILLLVWFLSKLGFNKGNDFEGLRNRMFNDNVQTMKETGLLYFTEDRLPSKIGDSVIITLKELIDSKHILPIKDFDGNKCDVDRSFISITKKDNHYEMMVNLKCADEEDYIIVDVGCYAYCNKGYICEKVEPEKPKPNPQPQPKPNPNPQPSTNPYCELTATGTKGTNGWYTGNVTITFKKKSAGNSSSLVEYKLYPTGQNAASLKMDKYVVSNEGTTTVVGYVKDSKGRTATCNITVKKDSVKPLCNLVVTSGTKDTDGVYVSNVVIGFKNNSDVTSKTNTYGLTTSSTVTYNKLSSITVTSNGKTKIYGYVKDNAGNTATCDITVNKKTPVTPISVPSCTLEVKSGTKENDYYLSNVTVGFKNKQSTNGASITAFGIGTSTTYANNSTYIVNNNGTSTVMGYVKDSQGRTATCKITITKKTKQYEYSKYFADQYSSWSAWSTYTYNPSTPPSFGNYNLIQIENLGKKTVFDYYKETTGPAIYQNQQVKVGTATQTYCTDYKYIRLTNSTTTYAIKEGTGWNFHSMVTTSGAPTDTLSVKYEFVGFDWKCTGCERTPRKIWNKYTRSVGVATSSNTVVTSGINVTCAKTAVKTIEIYDNVSKFVRYDIIKVPVYKEVYEYRRRTRTLIKAAYTDFKWSTYNNTTLLNSGYKLTGKTRVIV